LRGEGSRLSGRITALAALPHLWLALRWTAGLGGADIRRVRWNGPPHHTLHPVKLTQYPYLHSDLLAARVCAAVHLAREAGEVETR
jgi:hypothetical protein